MQDNYNEEDVIKNIQVSVWVKLIKVILKSKKNLIYMVSFAIMLAILDALTTVVNQFAITNFINADNYEYYVPYVIVSMLVVIGFGVSIFAFIHHGGIIEAEVNYNLRKEAFQTLQKLPFSYYDKTPHGWIMARMTSDSRKLSNVISWGLIDMVWAGLLMIATLVIVYIYNWQLALIVTASLPLMFLIAWFFRKRVLYRNRQARFYNSELTAKYNEGFKGAKTSKSLVIEDSNLMEFDYTADLMKRASIKAVKWSSMFSSALLMMCYIIVSIVMFTGTDYVVNHALDIGVLYLFIRSTIGFFDPVLVMTNFISQLQQAQASAERILELIYTEPEIKDRPDVVEKYGDWFNKKYENWEPLHGDIEFKDVTFYYNENEIILDHFNLKIKRGQSVALVGHTGSGKTTIVNLTSRFYEPRSGEILIDGKDYRERSIAWLHEKLGYVLQSPHLFSTTIMENIRYGRLNATDEEVIEASKAIGLHTFVMNLEKGYDTHVGEGGNLLSLGQKQLISFARAILANPRILILDEATSSIDSEAESIIQEATQRLLKGRTSLIVAHRLSTIVESDLILMLDEGKIIEMGTHEELLKLRGAYFDLYKNQFLAEKEQQYSIAMERL